MSFFSQGRYYAGIASLCLVGLLALATLVHMVRILRAWSPRLLFFLLFYSLNLSFACIQGLVYLNWVIQDSALAMEKVEFFMDLLGMIIFSFILTLLGLEWHLARKTIQQDTELVLRVYKRRLGVLVGLHGVLLAVFFAASMTIIFYQGLPQPTYFMAGTSCLVTGWMLSLALFNMGSMWRLHRALKNLQRLLSIELSHYPLLATCLLATALVTCRCVL
jgi:hypothetical protein